MKRQEVCHINTFNITGSVTTVLTIKLLLITMPSIFNNISAHCAHAMCGTMYLQTPLPGMDM